MGIPPGENISKVEVNKRNCVDYCKDHQIDDLLEGLKDSLSRVKPPDPLLFLLRLLQHKIALRQDSEIKHDNLLYSPTKSVSPVRSKERLPSLVLNAVNGEGVSDGSDTKFTGKNGLLIARVIESDETSCNSQLNNKPTLENLSSVVLVDPAKTEKAERHSTKTAKNQGCFGHVTKPDLSNEEDSSVVLTRKPTLTFQTGESFHLDTFMDAAEPPKAIWAIDIGGTLAKIVVYEPNNVALTSPLHHRLKFLKAHENYGGSGVRDKHMKIQLKNGTFHFLHFLSSEIEAAIDLLLENKLLQAEEEITATGGGAYKYADMFLSKTGCNIIKIDELQSLLWGLDFLLRNVPDECYYFRNPDLKKESKKGYQNFSKATYPYLLCNIGSGVSIMKIMGPHRFERVSGTCIGGGTFIGLCRMLCGGSTPEELSAFKGADAFQMALDGVANKVDMTVGDIYGGAYKSFNLRADTVASAFGKVATRPSILKDLKPPDFARSLLNMIGMNIAQLAYLCAMRYKMTRIVFCGNFLRQKNNKLSMRSISYSIDYWSEGTMKACFLKHEGYLGSIGAFVLRNAGAMQTATFPNSAQVSRKTSFREEALHRKSSSSRSLH